MSETKDFFDLYEEKKEEAIKAGISIEQLEQEAREKAMGVLEHTTTPMQIPKKIDLKALRMILESIYEFAEENKGECEFAFDLHPEPVLLPMNGEDPVQQFINGNRSITVTIKEAKSDEWYIARHNENNS